MDRRWIPGNDFSLLENGEEFFPRVFACIANARREVIVETFILFEDKVGLQLQEALIAAARRGAQVDITIDDWGSPDLSAHFLDALRAAGVRVHSFNPGIRPFGWRPHLLRRMHRKIVVVDREVAFVGGINYSADHLADYGPEAKQDYAVELEGPIVADIRSFALAALGSGGTGQFWRHPARIDRPPAGDAEVLFALRDNARRTNEIEREYRRAIRAARREIIIANAYFFPGFNFLRALRHAARRGVRVTLICQGEPDSQVARAAARTLYRHLVEGGVRIHEYCTRPFHGKVALIDDDWATVGSSNLDPLSLSLNLEANVFVRDPAFVRDLRARMTRLLEHDCRAVDRAALPPRRFWHVLSRPLLFHVLRRFPRWAGLLPAHTPRVALVQAPAGVPSPPA